MKLTTLGSLLIMLTCACAPADAQMPHMAGPVTAGPAHPIEVPPGDTITVGLENATDPAAVFQSDGLVVAGDTPVMLSARVAFSRGTGAVTVQVGPRGGPWRSVATAAEPPIITPIIIAPQAGEVARLVVTSALGAELRSGPPHRTYLTAVPVPPIAR